MNCVETVCGAGSPLPSLDYCWTLNDDFETSYGAVSAVLIAVTASDWNVRACTGVPLPCLTLPP